MRSQIYRLAAGFDGALPVETRLKVVRLMKLLQGWLRQLSAAEVCSSPLALSQVHLDDGDYAVALIQSSQGDRKERGFSRAILNRAFALPSSRKLSTPWKRLLSSS